MKKFNGFVAMFVLNAILLWLAVLLLSNYYVLMTFMGSWWFALIATAFVWTVITFLTQPVLVFVKLKIKKGMMMALAYLVANFIAIWGVARIGIGFGVRSFVWVFVLAFVADLAQFVIWMILSKMKLAEM